MCYCFTNVSLPPSEVVKYLLDKTADDVLASQAHEAEIEEKAKNGDKVAIAALADVIPGVSIVTYS